MHPTTARVLASLLSLPVSGLSAPGAEAALAPDPPSASPAPLADAELSVRLARWLDAAAAEGFTGVVLVARRGAVLVERGYGARVPGTSEPVRPDTVFTTGSITKQFTAAAILKLEELGRLSVADPIDRHLPGVPADKRALTIHHLLTHTAGFPGAIGDDRERIGRDEFVRRALATPLASAPGATYAYSNVGYSLAAAIVERAAGESYERFLRERLFLPAGMRDTGYHLPAWDPARLAHGVRRDGGDWGTPVAVLFADGGPGWHLLGNGGILSTAADMFHWHRALAGDALLSAASKAKLYGKQVEEGGGTWYGYGWSIEPTPWGELTTHNGGNPFFFADFLRFLDADVVVYFATSSPEQRMRRIGRPLARIAFTGEAPPLPPRATALRAPASESAPAGSAAARWGLPGTAAGERAAALLDALAAPEAAARAAFAADGFGAGPRARRGVEGLAQLLERMRGDLGAFRLAGYRPGEAGGLAVVLAPERGPDRMTVELEVEPDPPHRIAALGVTRGE
jgi:CubicO group peptidase (beta-lactamase class C family)